MNRSRDHVVRSLGWQSSRFLVALLLLAACLAGCGGKAQQTSETASPGAQEGVAGATSPINLNWSAQDTCVSFVPNSTTIHPGDRVNFTTNAPSAVTVNVPAGLFSAADSTILVNRGANNNSPTARAPGTYPLSSSPKACKSPTGGGGGPSIIVDEGENKK